MSRGIFHAVGGLLALCMLLLAITARQLPAPVWLAVGVVLLAWVAFAVAWRFREGGTMRGILFWALLCRLLLWFSPPLFEDDQARYLWDGWVFLSTGSPYALPPADFFGSSTVPESMFPVLDAVNYPSVPTLYPPFCQYLFAACAGIAPGALWPWKGVVALADLAILLLLTQRCRKRHLLLYAWCPLVLVEGALNVHTDLIGVALITAAALYSARSWLHPWRTGAGATLALGARWLAAVPLAFLYARRIPWIAVPIAAGVMALLCLPFLLRGQTPGLDGMQIMSAEWQFNPLMFHTLSLLFGDSTARMIASLGFVAISGALWWGCRKRQIGRCIAVQASWAVCLLLSPVVNAWYLLWLFPFALWRPTVTAYTAMAAVSLTWLTGLNLADPSLGLHQLLPGVREVQLGLILTALFIDLRMTKTGM